MVQKPQQQEASEVRVSRAGQEGISALMLLAQLHELATLFFPIQVTVFAFTPLWCKARRSQSVLELSNIEKVNILTNTHNR